MSLSYKLVILIVLIFNISLARSENIVPYRNIMKCFEGMGLQHSGNDGKFAIIPTSKNQILVVTESGAKTVNSNGKEFDSDYYVFVADGQKEKIKTYTTDGKFEGTMWFGVENHIFNPSKVKGLNISETIKLAGSSAKAYTQREKPSLKLLDAFLRHESRNIGNGIRNQRNFLGEINQERLDMKSHIVEKSLAALSYCDQVDNEDIKEAAKIEKQHLDEIKAKLNSYRDEQEIFKECVKEKMLKQQNSDSSNGANVSNR